jgi:hypothetical protein
MQELEQQEDSHKHEIDRITSMLTKVQLENRRLTRIQTEDSDGGSCNSAQGFYSKWDINESILCLQ